MRTGPPGNPPPPPPPPTGPPGGPGRVLRSNGWPPDTGPDEPPPPPPPGFTSRPFGQRGGRYGYALLGAGLLLMAVATGTEVGGWLASLR